MKRYALITALGLLGATAWAGTFELSDPANEMYEEQQEREEELARIKEESAEAWAEEAAEYDAAVAASAAGNILCTVDTKTGACTCIDKEQARKLSLTQEECAARVLQAVQGGNP